MLQVSVPIGHELLAQCAKQGHALVQRASLVGDYSDYESWKSARKQWIEPTAQALEHMYGGPAQAREFHDLVTASDGGARWQQRYASDLDAVKQAIDFLTVLQGELAFAREGLAPDPETRELTATTGEERGAEPALVHDEPAAHMLAPEPVDEDDPLVETDPLAHAPPHSAEVSAELSRAPSAEVELAGQDTPAAADRAGAPGRTAAASKQILVAHGRSERWMRAVVHVLEQTGAHEVTILNERAGGQGGLADRFGHPAPDSRYAVVLLTCDDIAAPREEAEEEPYFSPRAHQGVVFEMGFLVAALAPGHVCVLYEEGVQLPCSIDEVPYVRLDPAGTWQPKLLLQLRRAGFEHDLNKLVAA
jgi:predicted nucleotide-binding protein